MLKCLFLLLRKDLTLLLRGQAWLHSLLFGLLLIFLLCLTLFDESSLNATSPSLTGQGLVSAQGLTGLQPRLLPAIFWLASTFFLLTLTVQIYAQDETSQAKQGLLSLGLSPHIILLGKYLTCLVLLFTAQMFFWLGLYVFASASLSLTPNSLLVLGLGNTGLVTLACLLGPLAACAPHRQGFLALLFFPLAVPVLLACLSLTLPESAAENLALSNSNWFLLLAAFDCIFCGLALLLFPLLYKE